MIRRPPRSTQSRSSAASDVYKRQHEDRQRRSIRAPARNERERQRERRTQSEDSPDDLLRAELLDARPPPGAFEPHPDRRGRRPQSFDEAQRVGHHWRDQALEGRERRPCGRLPKKAGQRRTYPQVRGNPVSEPNPARRERPDHEPQPYPAK